MRRLSISVLDKNWQSDCSQPEHRGHRAKCAEALKLIGERIRNGADQADYNIDGLIATFTITNTDG